MRSKSAKLVSSSGVPPTGPVAVGPTKAVVLVPTPSIDLLRKLTSSTYTPGARYSGTMHLVRSGIRGPSHFDDGAPAAAGRERDVVRVDHLHAVLWRWSGADQDRLRIGHGQRRRALH